MKLCLVEDDLELGRAIQAAVRDAGHDTVWVRRAAEARLLLRDPAFDGAMLDLGLPDGDGFEVLLDTRRRRPSLAVIVITARDALSDRLRGLDLGADDYLVKPFAIAELLARLRAVVRRTSGGEAGLWEVRGLTIDEHRMLVSRRGDRVPLSKSEFAILVALARSAGRVLTRRDLEARALPNSEAQSLDAHMSNLRRKIGDGYIRTVRGIGYVIEK